MKPTNTMTSRVEEYLTYRRNLGFELRIEGRQLLHFARWADQSGHRGAVTIDLVVGWATLTKKHQSSTWVRRLAVVRPFARYCALFDPGTEVPPPRLLGADHRRFVPHIYSNEEIQKLLAAARELGPAEGLRPKTYATLFGLLACSGLRISEALALKRCHVDFRAAQMTILQAKFRKSRIVPLHSSAIAALGRYSEARDKDHPRSTAGSYFLSSRGTALSYSAVASTFVQLRKSLGWTPSASGHLPRIHDLRHHADSRIMPIPWYAVPLRVPDPPLVGVRRL